MTNDTPKPFDFSDVSLSALEAMTEEQRNALPYGVVGLSAQGIVEIYNETESRMAGLPQEKVVGSAFFLSVAQCMNNFMVAQRLADEPELDVSLPYVLTFRMRPTPVTLRLLKAPGAAHAYLLILR